MKTKSTLAAVAILIEAGLGAPSAWADPGDLDLSFGRNGKVATNFTPGDDMAFGVAVQPDGMIVAVGSADFENRFALARYTADGTLDASFDGDGRLTTAFTGAHDAALDLAIQADGRIVAVGTAGFESYALARYQSDGSLDPSFGGGGKVLTELTGGRDVAAAVTIQADGKIVVAGRSAGARGRFALARYESDGSLDTSFGGAGIVFTDFTSRNDFARDVSIDANGKVVVAGRAGRAGGRFALARYESDGRLDTSFGRDGRVVTNFTSGDDHARGVAIRPHGRIVVAGGAARGGGSFALARYESDGSLDVSFGGDGKVLTNLTQGVDIALGIAIQSNRRIVVAGHAGGTRLSPRNHKLAIARYRPNGALDPSFSGDGKRAVDFTSGDDWAEDVAIQPDGRIVAAGRAAGAGGRFALARFSA
jgi:uncharacterized delta-60 repeat protein